MAIVYLLPERGSPPETFNTSYSSRSSLHNAPVITYTCKQFLNFQSSISSYSLKPERKAVTTRHIQSVQWKPGFTNHGREQGGLIPPVFL